MVIRRPLVLSLLLLGLLSACGRRVGNSAPRISTVPAQTGTSNATFTLDLAPYVADDGPTVTYTVVSGGGAFTGSVYSRQFPTLGTYNVSFQVNDGAGKTATGAFTVRITSATLMVIQLGDSLALWETTTSDLAQVSTANGHTDTFKVALASGAVVYERTVGAQTDLYMFDPNKPQTFTLGDDAAVSETYQAKTSTDKVLFTTGPAGNRDLFLHDPVSGFTSAVSNVTGQDEGNVFVNASDLVFYQRQSAGQYDVHYHDLATGTSTEVAAGPTNEVIRAVLPDGGIVFSRVGTGGEQDLHYFRVGTGVLTIGADLEGTIGTMNKAYAGRTSASRVVFTAHDGSDFDLYVWNPATGQTAVIAATAVDETLAGVSALDKVFYNVQTGPANNDLRRFDPATATSTPVAGAGTNEVFAATLSDGDLVYTDESVTGRDVYRWDDATEAVVASLTAGATDYVFRAVLSGDNVVTTNSTLGLVLLTATGSTVVDADPTAAFGGETSGGDFVYSLTTAAQTDLYLWDESSASTLPISQDAGAETFGIMLSGDRVAYSRVASGGATSNVFVWSPESGVSTQVTDNTVNDTPIVVFSATNP